ncbi:hypothetical protein BDB00DRAFT_879141 [Zychaea mexicana]|uniref:uncharacterized protein n=1 Tax=Zychaea mexicana TaxID=64656 RepID=UPI0022FEDEEC|nr:uncharacterized protein BDB00DRAFT_879141 [Zychaea mexicana]KAI9482502.1 hypothetical protein BDB00DRAFT_879141 [Zychaea mexicana]
MTATFPIELIDHIFTFVDSSSLFQLCQCSRLFRTLAFPRLTSQHMSRATIRLWIEQPGMVGHKPMDFEWSDFDKERGKLVFTAKPDQHYHTFNKKKSSEAPVIDGLTVLSTGDKGDRRIHSVSYKKAAAVPASLTVKQNELTCVSYPGSSSKKDTAYACAWQLRYGVQEQQQQSSSTCTIVPKTFECDLDLLDPTVLGARINKAPVTKPCIRENNIPASNNNSWKSTFALAD